MLLLKLLKLVFLIILSEFVSPALIECECGLSIPIRTRVLGGKSSAPNTLRWMAALVSNTNGKVFCGGSLINSKFVLTAAHCMMNQDSSTFHVVMGEVDSLMFSRTDSIFQVNQIYTHPAFSGPPNYSNDLSLIELVREIDLMNSTKISSVCLATPGPIGSPLMVAGWGFIANGGPQPRILQEAVVIQQSQFYCQSIYGSKFTSKHVCANDPQGNGVCNGDSGGPLMLKTGEKMFAMGVVSYGLICGDTRFPAVFTRTQSYLNWIFSVTKPIGSYCIK